MDTLLIVDDNALHLRLYKKEFNKEGFSVLTTQSGTEALALMETSRPSLIILDPMIMSDMDGDAILDHIIEQGPGLPVVLNTSYSAVRDPSMIRRADAYVLKSSNLEELKSKVNAILRMSGRELLSARQRNLSAPSPDRVDVEIQ